MKVKIKPARNKQLKDRLSSDPITMTGLLRLEQVLRLIPLSKSTWWAGCREGRFPPPVHLSKRVTAWRASDIQRVIDGENKIGVKEIEEQVAQVAEENEECRNQTGSWPRERILPRS